MASSPRRERAAAPEVVYLLLTEFSSASAAGSQLQSRSTAASRCTRSSVQSALQVLGCKARYASKVATRLFAHVTGLVQCGELSRPPSRRDPTCRTWSCHQHGGDESGQLVTAVYVALPRPDFKQLLLQHLTAYNYHCSQHELEIACRCEGAARKAAAAAAVSTPS
jgi:hypothetical protein